MHSYSPLAIQSFQRLEMKENVFCRTILGEAYPEFSMRISLTACLALITMLRRLPRAIRYVSTLFSLECSSITSC